MIQLLMMQSFWGDQTATMSIGYEEIPAGEVGVVWTVNQ